MQEISWFFEGGFFGFLKFFLQHCFICCPANSTVSEEAGIEFRVLATFQQSVRHEKTLICIYSMYMVGRYEEEG
jgi:hypothetical protein